MSESSVKAVPATSPVVKKRGISALLDRLHHRHKFRLTLVGHKAVETGATCLLLMVQGQLAMATLNHVAIASETGLLTVVPLLGITLTRHARHLANRWSCAFLVG